MAQIQVAVRCRPFTIDDDLGVKLLKTGEGQGETEVIDSKYTQNTRFPFSWAWWSAYGYKRRCKKNIEVADAMELINQSVVYEECGVKIKEQVLDGSAVVLFAYGLSGSGKTFTVFGPDDPIIPEAWFKHSKPHDMWGIFPRLAYDIFDMKQDGWVVRLKYFQNVVDTVRDLMSPDCNEQSYKTGMRKDPDGFMDVEWCLQRNLNSWDDLRTVFQEANGRKAISPTQFNHQSTRGHCIMVLEVEMPNPENPAMKKRGRIYVCDLAGTEPAGDIVYAKYETKSYPDGSVDHIYLGPHEDQRKTKELQDQGKKINLSLTEMAQFFMKMAEGVKKKTLKPGTSIPGCNSYFLCKFLKDTMLQAQTYLFAAIRPEKTYHNYTYATLGFAMNASVIKLAPKKASTGASPAEMEFMRQIDEMKALVKSLQEENSKLGKGGGGDGGNNDALMQQAMENLMKKQAELNSALTGEASNVESKLMDKQKEEYFQRGLYLTALETDVQVPYFVNVDEDPFRSKRFLFKIEKNLVVVGRGNDVQPFAISVKANHCDIEKEDNDKVFITPKGGRIIVNGKILAENSRTLLNNFDRVALDRDLYSFYNPKNVIDDVTEKSIDDIMTEYNLALNSEKDAANSDLAKRMDEFERMKKIWEEQKNKEAEDAKIEAEAQKGKVVDAEVQKGKNEAAQREAEKVKLEQENQMKAMQQEMLQGTIKDLVPKLTEAKMLCDAVGREALSFKPSLFANVGAKSHEVNVRIEVHNGQTEENIQIEVYEFNKALSWLKDEVKKLKLAIDSGSDYIVEKARDPLTLFFDNTYHLGNAIFFPEMLAYNMGTEGEDNILKITNAVHPYNNVGSLEVKWTPLGSPDSPDSAPADIDSLDDLIGKPWTFKCEIVGAFNLPVSADEAYISYNFFGEECITENVEQNTMSPVWNYSRVHHVASVEKDFVDWLTTESIIFRTHINPYIAKFPEPIKSSDPIVIEKLTGKKVKKVTTGELQKENDKLKKEIETLKLELQAAKDEITSLKGADRVSTPSKKLREAQAIDGAVNGEVPK